MGGRHKVSEPVKSLNDAFSPLKVFVYGTLKPGKANYQEYCSDQGVDTRVAIARGQLFSLPAGYPAMTLGEGRVHGFVLSFKDHAVLSQLDDYEGYQVGRSPQHNLYERYLIETFDPTERSLGSAWAYLMSLERVRYLKGTLLPEGEWN